MCLDPHIERVIRELDHLNDMSVRGLSGEHHAVRCKVITVVIVDLKTMSVALVDHICSVEGICFRLFIKDTRICLLYTSPVFLHIGRRIHVGLEHRGEHLFRSLVIDHALFKEFDQCCQMLCGKDDL